MSNKHPSQEELIKKLQTPGPTLNTPPVNKLSPPVQEMAIQVELDQLRPYDRNPRTLPNPKYQEIKDSIRAVGLKHPPVVTKRPGDDKYMISDGGNTRLKILQELYQETGDARFSTLWVIYRPWQSEAAALAGHLSENETRGDLTWIEKSLGLMQLKQQLEAETGDTLSQRELARRARELGFAVNHGHISRMLYTVEHLWPTLPMTLESGMGHEQIKRLISYREACLLIWRRCEAPEDDFAPAWHETVSYFDHEGQTVLPWSMVEDRLLGMIEDATEVYLSAIDNALQRILEHRKRRSSFDDPDVIRDIWLPLDTELGRLRDPDAHPPLQFYPPFPGEEPEPQSRAPRTPRGRESLAAKEAGEPQDQEPGGAADHDAPLVGVRKADAVHDSRVDELQRELERLRQKNAELQEQQGRSSRVMGDDVVLGNGLDSVLPELAHDDEDEAPLELDDDAHQQRLDDLTLSPVHESVGHRRLREMLAQDQGEQAVDFESNALRAVPLMSAGPMHPIIDLWAIEPQYRGPRELRIQIAQFAQALARWAGFNLPEEPVEQRPVIPSYDDGAGYTLQPLSDDQAQSVRAQQVWQLLAGLLGEIHPAYPTDTTLLAELLGTSGNGEPMPDEVLVRFFRLTRLMRVLRDQLRDQQQQDAVQGGES